MFANNISYPATFLAVALVSCSLTPENLTGQITRTGPVSPKPKVLPSNWNGDLVEIPSARDGVILFIGVEIKPGDKVPESERFSIKAGADERKFRRLAVGDVIEKGQLIGRLDETLARAGAAVRQAMVATNEILLAASEKKREGAQSRFLAEKKRVTNGRFEGSLEDLRGFQFAYNRCVCEAKSRLEALKVAKLELGQARTVLEMHQIPSPVRGIVRRISKRNGESVRALETLVTLQIVNEGRTDAAVNAASQVKHGELVQIRGQSDGVICFLGTPIEKGEKALEQGQHALDSGKAIQSYKGLRVGAVIEKGQILAQLDDRLSRADLAIKQAKVSASEADLLAGEKARDQCQHSWQVQEKLHNSSIRCPTAEDVRASRQVFDKSVADVKSGSDAVKLAKHELEQAQVVLDKLQIRSSVRGIVGKTHKHDGEAVKAFETVVTLQIVKDEDK
jgi:multidrug resistance efflux pump